MPPIDTVISEDGNRIDEEVRVSVQLFPEGVRELMPDALRPRHMTGENAVDMRLVNPTSAFRSYEPATFHGSKQHQARNDKDEELRLAQVDIKDRLNKVDSGLRALKEKLKAKEEQFRARRNMPKSTMTAEKELKTRIDKAKEELSARERHAAARHTKKNEMRAKWAKKQMADDEEREAKRRQQA